MIEIITHSIHCENCHTTITPGSPAVIVEEDWLHGPTAYIHLNCNENLDCSENDQDDQ